ncbi:hypothetical protein FH008_15690, partial [Listeria monocytogenes]|nr:hypothetical protein [Listeria monocytogenes]
MPVLRGLDASGSRFANLELSGLSSFQYLILDNSQVSDLSALSNISSLKTLSIRNSQVSDLSPLSGLSNLEFLDITGNQVSDLSPLSGLNSMHSIYADNNQISEVNLNGLTALTDFRADNNQIRNVDLCITNLFYLTLNNNQISDLDFLAGPTALQNINMESNQISDISSLSNLENSQGLEQIFFNFANNRISDVSVITDVETEYSDVYLFARNQNAILPEIKWSPSLEVPVEVKSIDNSPVTPQNISNSGQFADGVITWTGLSNTDQNVVYSWNENRGRNVEFTGTATTRVTPIAVKILIDDDGNSQTTGDQSLFAEEASNIDYLEDIYNYVKEELSGTDYGLLEVQVDSNGIYNIIVSKVGSLKTENVNGDSIGTDKAYTPNYTVTGTGNAAQLEVSYGVTVDSAPGYVYIYEKNTPQEIRYVPGGAINIPLTDIDSNGVPQWREDYTVVQYQRAGALNPSLPDGSQVPGGTITVPDDAVAGDLITVPDTITGSNGHEYGVDPSVVDTDSNTPGVQITLTDEEQDVAYFDITLSESESESASLSESESTSTSISESESTSISES